MTGVRYRLSVGVGGQDRLLYSFFDWASPVPVTLPTVSVVALSASEARASALATVASKSSILRSNAES